MPTPLPDLQQQLLSAGRRICRLYHEASETLVEMKAAMAQCHAPQASLARLNELMTQVAAIESAAAAARSEWAANGHSPNRELQAVLNEQRQLIEKLLPEIEQVTGTMQAARDRLTPRLDSHSQRRQMQEAYAAS